MAIKILLVDDEMIERRFVRSVLAEICPAAQITADLDDPLEALACAQRQDFDLAFLDIKMPELDGLDLAKELRALQPHCFIVIHTAYADFSFAQRAIEAGVNSYTLKPTHKEDFIRVLAKFQEGHKACQELEDDYKLAYNSLLQAEHHASNKPLLAEIDQYIFQNYRENFNLEKMGQDLHYNPEYLSREFRKQRGLTIKQQQQELRIKAACYELSHSPKNISQISSDLGFLSLSTFYKHFKALTGKTPKQFALDQQAASSQEGGKLSDF